MQVTIHFDGGSRGNPGPAAAAAALTDSEDNFLASEAIFLGHYSNNVAEYTGLLLGIKLAKKLSVESVEIVGDSKLVISQILGEWKVRHPDMQRLHQEALKELQSIKWSARWTKRSENTLTDNLVNQCLDQAALDK